jgi:uncharacterized protein (TIGR02145 family)
MTQWANLTTGAWCYYNNDPANGAIYGKIYNAYAVNDPRGLAPQGWHVPTNPEYGILSSFLGGFTVAGGKMKQVGTTNWLAPNTGATNSSGFTGLPGGYRSALGNFFDIGNNINFWTSTISGTGNNIRSLSRTSSILGSQGRAFDHGSYVRLVKD